MENIETILSLAREFVTESDERSFNYDQATRWFQDRRDSIEVEIVHPNDTTAYWKLILVSEGDSGVLIPEIRSAGYDTKRKEFYLSRYFDLYGYSEFDPLKAKYILDFPVQVSDGKGNWNTTRKGIISTA